MCNYGIVTAMIMSKKDKKIHRLLTLPSDYTYDEAKSLLCSFGFCEDNKGRTSGSRIRFYREFDKRMVLLHKPHPDKTMHRLAVKQLAEFIETVL